MSERRYIVLVGLSCAITATVILMVDHKPRFFLGDSISYLSTDGTYIPSDRSWMFGFGVSWLLRTTHSHTAYLIAQVSLFLAVVAFCSASLLPATPWRPMCYAAFALFACLDPMLNLYARFYMTDFLACLLFVAFLCCLCRALRASWTGFLYWLPALAALITAAVFVRVAYMPIAVLTILIASVGAIRCRHPGLGRLALAFLLPPLAAMLLMMANSAVFADRFPGERFLTKLSGVFLMATFAPALTAADFRAAGVLVSDAEVELLDLPNYDKRGVHIWGSDERSAQALIKRHLGISEDYTARIESVCSAIVWSAMRRDPLAVTNVYANTLLMHFQPSQWRRYLDHEIGLTRTLPQGFVDWVNRLSNEPITAGITTELSPALVAFRWFAPVYPLLLLAGLAAACWRLLARQATMASILVSAGFVAVLATAPLYTVYVIPRYVIAAVFLGCLLYADLAARLFAASATGRQMNAKRLLTE